MAQLRLEETANKALDELNESGPPHLWDRVNDVIDALEDDPTNQINRRRLYRRAGGTVWGIPVRSGPEDWLILWHHDGQGPVVVYIGPDLPTP